MSVNITTIFGTQISVSPAQAITERSFIGFPGANGTTSMSHGARGWLLQISGRLWASGYGSYDNNRANIQNQIAAIEARGGDSEIDLYYRNWTYYNCVILPLPQGFQCIPDGSGKIIHGDAAKCWCDFVSLWRVLA